MFTETTVNLWGHSQAIRLPREVVGALGLKPKDKVRLELNGNCIKMTKSNSYPSIEELLEGYEGEGAQGFSWGKPMGLEILEPYQKPEKGLL